MPPMVVSFFRESPKEVNSTNTRTRKVIYLSSTGKQMPGSQHRLSLRTDLVLSWFKSESSQGKQSKEDTHRAAPGRTGLGTTSPSARQRKKKHLKSISLSAELLTSFFCGSKCGTTFPDAWMHAQPMAVSASPTCGSELLLWSQLPATIGNSTFNSARSGVNRCQALNPGKI